MEKILLFLTGTEGSCGCITGILLVVLLVLLAALLTIKIKRCKRSKASSVTSSEKASEEIAELKSEIARLREEKQKSFENGSLYSLILLQREGRLIDFLMENIKSYDDSQVGAAVRQIHSGCAKVINEKFAIKPLITSKNEGETISLGSELNSEEIRLTGNVPAAGPYGGVIRHKGWVSSKVELPKIVNKENFSIICQAEVESM